jgi:hypothetical protein
MARRLLDPLPLSLTILCLQALVWYLVMPDMPSVPGGAPRFVSMTSIVRYGIFLLVWAIAIALAKSVTRGIAHGKRDTASPDGLDFSFLERVLPMAIVLTVFGELLYARDVLQNPGMIMDAIRGGAFTNIGEQVTSERLVGLSSLNNLFVIPAAVWSMMAFNPAGSVAQRQRGRQRLLILGAAVLLHALLFVGRQLFINFLLIVVAAYLLLNHPSTKALMRSLLAVVLVISAVAWLGETMRTGLHYAHENRYGLFSAQTQGEVGRRLVEAYFAADVNNSMVLFSCPPPMQPLFGTLLQTPAAALNVEFVEYQSCSLFVSRYGTSTIFAVWWWAAGWGGLVYALGFGAWLGATYVLATEKKTRSVYTAVVFLISFPGIAAMIRINYFTQTAFVLPIAYLLFARLFQRDAITDPIWPRVLPKRGLATASLGSGTMALRRPARGAGLLAGPRRRPQARWGSGGTPPAAPAALDACPYLRLAGDPTRYVPLASPAHRCRGRNTPSPVPIDIQRRRCLTAEHNACPVLLEAQATGRQP